MTAASVSAGIRTLLSADRAGWTRLLPSAQRLYPRLSTESSIEEQLSVGSFKKAVLKLATPLSADGLSRGRPDLDLWSARMRENGCVSLAQLMKRHAVVTILNRCARLVDAKPREIALLIMRPKPNQMERCAAYKDASLTKSVIVMSLFC